MTNIRHLQPTVQPYLTLSTLYNTLYTLWGNNECHDSHLKGYLQWLSEYTTTMVQMKHTTLYNTLAPCVDKMNTNTLEIEQGIMAGL